MQSCMKAKQWNSSNYKVKLASIWRAGRDGLLPTTFRVDAARELLKDGKKRGEKSDAMNCGNYNEAQCEHNQVVMT